MVSDLSRYYISDFEIKDNPPMHEQVRALKLVFQSENGNIYLNCMSAVSHTMWKCAQTKREDFNCHALMTGMSTLS